MPLRRWRKLRAVRSPVRARRALQSMTPATSPGWSLREPSGTGVVEGLGVAELPVDLVDDRQAGQRERFAGGELGTKACVPRDHGLAGEVACADVFGQGEGDRPGDGFVVRRGGLHAGPGTPRKRMRRLA